MSSNNRDNPYEAPSAALAASAAANAVYTSKALADEIRREDAAMASDLSALAPRSRVGHSGRASTHIRSGGAAVGEGTVGDISGAGATLSSRGGKTSGKVTDKDNTATLLFTENTTTEAYIDKTREVGLVRMSLAAKKMEIRKLEEDIDRAEKHLRQKQEQLESTREKFNSFLKYSNLEQDAAVRRADTETKAKQEKVMEIKKLSARMSHVELDIRKAQLQLESCRAYKKFFDNLAKPKWFYDVLAELRTADRTEEILLDTEDAFEKRSEELQKAYNVAVAEREAILSGGAASASGSLRDHQHGKHLGGGMGAAGKRQNNALYKAGGMEDEELPEIVPLEIQVKELDRTLAAEAQTRVDEETARIRTEVDALTLEDVKDCLSKQYDESRIPMYFSSVDELLEVFINVEEGNLFLIQNCQELEEELETVAISHLTEKTDTQTMTNQRQAQMQVLAEKIEIAQSKMKQLEDRAAALDRHVPTAAAGAPIGATSARGAGKSAPSSARDGDGGENEPTLTPEMYRGLVEKSISDNFRTLNAGETIIKQLTMALQRHTPPLTLTGDNDQRQQHQSNEDGDGLEGTSATTKSGTAVSSGTLTAKTAGNGHTAAAANRPQAKKASAGGGVGSTGPAGKTKTGKKAKGSSATNNAAASATAAAGGASGGNDAGANMGAVELLTIIENKIQEYQRFITDPANGVDEALILNVMKNADKERRRQARLEHMTQQAKEQEERSRKALERSQAPVVKRVGKPVLRRSRLPRGDEMSATAGGANATVGGAKSRRRVSAIDEESAEFFK